MENISQVLILGNLLLNSFHNLLRLFSGNGMTGTFLNMLCYLCCNKLRCRFDKRISGIGAFYIGVSICIMKITPMGEMPILSGMVYCAEVDGHRQQRIQIVYNYIGALDIPSKTEKTA